MEEKWKILFVEDDHALAMGTEYALEDEGMEVFHAENFAAVQRIYEERQGKFDLALLDVMLPDADGYQVFAWLQSMDVNIPVIFLSALDDEGNVVHGLSIGGSDYVTKPFRMKELVARIRASIRKADKRGETVSREGMLLDEERYCLWKAGVRIELTPSEFRLLRELIRHSGQVLTREQLMDKLWSAEEAYVDDNTLSVYVRRIREKIDGKNTESYIKTVRGVGYTWRGMPEE
ncbi:MAG: response regulator transcription factor [Eubacteriales bacterium]|nr:response regulator transcription factor [Eubacteriales bacterium]